MQEVWVHWACSSLWTTQSLRRGCKQTHASFVGKSMGLFGLTTWGLCSSKYTYVYFLFICVNKQKTVFMCIMMNFQDCLKYQGNSINSFLEICSCICDWVLLESQCTVECFSERQSVSLCFMPLVWQVETKVVVFVAKMAGHWSHISVNETVS